MKERYEMKRRKMKVREDKKTRENIIHYIVEVQRKVTINNYKNITNLLKFRVLLKLEVQV